VESQNLCIGTALKAGLREQALSYRATRDT
jgi:hypothetical protein